LGLILFDTFVFIVEFYIGTQITFFQAMDSREEYLRFFMNHVSAKKIFLIAAFL